MKRICNVCSAQPETFINGVGMEFDSTPVYDTEKQCTVHKIIKGGKPTVIMFCGHDYAAGKAYREREKLVRQ